jgi:hypothetical protein
MNINDKLTLLYHRGMKAAVIAEENHNPFIIFHSVGKFA